MANISNGSIINDDMSSLSAWTDEDSGNAVSSQVTFDNKEVMKLVSGTGAGEAKRAQDIGSFSGARNVFSVSIYHSALGTRSNNDFVDIQLQNGTKYALVAFASDGLFISTSGGGYVEVGTNLVQVGAWQEWTFDVNWTATTIDVYLEGTLQQANVAIYTSGSTDGIVRIRGKGITTSDRISYIDWLKVGDGFEPSGTPSAYTHYKCNDDLATTVVIDTGIGANNGTGNVNTSNYSVVGKINKAFEFLATSSEYIDIDNLWTDIASDTTGSFSFWVYPNENAVYNTIISFGDTSGNEHLRIDISNTETIYAILRIGPASWAFRSSVLPTNAFTHVVIAHNGTTPVLYINGVEETPAWTNETDKTAWMSDLIFTDNGRIGCLNYNSGGNTGFFDGKVDDFRYYKSVLTLQDIQDIYQRGNGTEDDPASGGSKVTYAHFKCNDNLATTVVIDTGIGANNGTGNVNTSNYSVVGKINDAFEFVTANVENFHVDNLVADVNTDTTGSFSFWLDPTSVSITQYMIHFREAGSSGQMQIYANASSFLIYIASSTGNYVLWTQSSSFTTGWHHYSVVQNGTSLKVYKDGVDITDSSPSIVGTGAVGMWFDVTSIDQGRIACLVYIGGSDAESFGGKIDDIRYYKNTALTQQDILNIYAGGAGTEADPPPLFVSGNPRSFGMIIT